VTAYARLDAARTRLDAAYAAQEAATAAALGVAADADVAPRGPRGGYPPRVRRAWKRAERALLLTRGEVELARGEMDHWRRITGAG
jgi:hypothetical protein